MPAEYRKVTGERVTPLEKAEACRVDLVKTRERHLQVEMSDRDGSWDVCQRCHDSWPCDAARLLDYAEARLKRALEMLGSVPLRGYPSHDTLLAAADQEVSDLAKFLGVAE